jgi:hypothetical protein
MRIVLWLLQIALALKFLSVTYTHAVRPDEARMGPGISRLGALARPLLAVTALLSFLCSVGLVLPAIIGIFPSLTPWSAAMLALMMLIGSGLHLGCRDNPNVAVGLVLFAGRLCGLWTLGDRVALSALFFPEG